MLTWVILAAAVVTSLIAVELEDLNRSVLALAAMSTLVAVAHYLTGAWLLAVFQLSVYGGAVTMLLLSVVHTRGERNE